MLVGKAQFQKFVDEAAGEFDIFVLSRRGEAGDLALTKYDPRHEMVIFRFRPVDPLKILFYPSRDRVLPESGPAKKRIIIGVKNCDLAALALLDRALLAADTFTDFNYRACRENTYIIGADCTEVLPVCHCNLVDLEPYPEAGCDLALSGVTAGYRLEVRSAKGEELLNLIKKYVTPYSETGIRIEEQVAENRRRVKELLAEQNRAYTGRRFQDDKCGGAENEKWSALAGECVECGGCSYTCPTCYCILLNEETPPGGEFCKIRAWDSCQHTGYAVVAGGATPRPRLWQRFRHRYHCKFSVLPANFSLPGCTGCGRCISVCPAEIDLREVVNKLQVAKA